MDIDKRNQLLINYWASQKLPQQLLGVHPMGRGGIAEVLYRHYFEFRHFKKIVPLNHSMAVLELGCGNGRWALSIAPLVNYYMGIDISKNTLDIARREVKKKNIINANFYECSITDYLPNRAYDVIYFSGVSQYLEDTELLKILDNLSNYIKPDTVILDRSTVNYKERERMVTEKYFSIFRTPYEIANIFSKYEFHAAYQNRSYRFLRGSILFRMAILKRILYHIIRMCQPLSYFILLWLSFFADFINPVPFEGGARSHDFLLFKKRIST